MRLPKVRCVVDASHRETSAVPKVQVDQMEQAQGDVQRRSKMSQWHKDLLAEAVLKEWKQKYDVAEVEVSDFDKSAGLHNQARNIPLIEEVADSYTIAMKNGASFPAVVAYRKAKKLIILGGNHRLEAASRSGRQAILCYVVDCADDEQTIRFLTKALNLVVGVRPSRKDCVAAALSLMETCGIPAKKAAKLFCVSDTSLNSAKRAADARERLAAIGCRTLLDDGKLSKIGTVDNNNVLAKVAEIVEKGRLTLEETGMVLRDVAEKRTELEQLEVTSGFAKKYHVGTNGEQRTASPVASPIASDVRRALTRLEGLIHGKRTPSQLGFTKKAEQVELAERVGKLCKDLQGIVRRP